MRSDGYEIAVYRVDGGKIAQVWFYNEPSDAEAFSAVFAFDCASRRPLGRTDTL